MDHAAARKAIYSELQTTWLQTIETCRVLETVAATKEDHLKSPEPGCRLTQASVLSLIPEHRDVQIVITDGLSADAVHHNAEKLLPPLVNGLRRSNISIGLPIIVRNGRVKLAEHIAECLQPKLVVMLIGERPGGNSLASRSLSAYLAYAVAPDVLSEAARFSGNPEIRFEYTVISNIYSAGLPASEAARVITRKVLQILSHRAAGNRLESVLNPAGDLNSLYKRGPGRHE